MSVKRILPIAVAVLMIASVALGGAMAATPSLTSSSSAESNTHAGAHVSFETTGETLANYSVDDTSLISSIGVESSSDAEERGALGVGLTSVTAVEASALSVNAETDTQVAVHAESGAAIEAHDSQRGHLVVHAEDDGQVVAANLSGDAEAEQESDARVIVTHEDGTEGAFIVVGDGEVTVNEEGHVTAELAQDSALAYQQYGEERTDEDEAREQLIAEGTAAAEVYVSMAAEGGSEAAADVVEYTGDTAVEVTSYSENTIEVTAERAESDGRIILVTASEQAFQTAEDITVMVDGEAAVHAESTSELEAAADGGDDPAYIVRSSSTADASSEVLVALNHFSERSITMSGDDADAADDDADDGDARTIATDDDDDMLPGFGIALAGFALTISALLAARRSR